MGMRLRKPQPYVFTFTAAEALAAHRVVIFSATAGQVEYPAGADDTQIAGVTIAAADSGADVEVCMFGPCLCKVDGNAVNITVGGWLVTHNATGYATGQAINDGTTAHELLGRAMEASTADDDLISVWVHPQVAFLA